ncbi:extracellular solute-binding protein [Paenibacillus sp. KS-LC4]|uniref:ABC transporter substrate-binding protein n=1 Tax=Paenibacillus sp. KS-LC4 TaxID=2979727 RepID=UPI0030CE9087
MFNFHKSMIAGMILLLSTTLLLSACSGSNTEGKNGSNGSETTGDKEVTLRFSWWGGESRHQATLEAIKMYMDEHPNVTIEAEYGTFDGYYQKLQTQLSGGAAPDLIQLDYLWINDLVSQGDLFVDLNTLGDTIDLSEFDEQFLKDWAIINGKLQGLPTGINALTAITNKTFMEREGLPTDIDWTWEQVLEEGEKLHQNNADYYFINSDLATLTEKIVPSYHSQLTGRYLVNNDYSLGFDQQSMTQTFAFLHSLFERGVLQPLGESALYNAKTEQNPKWINGQTAMTIANVTDIPKHRGTAVGFDIATTLFPIKDNAVSSGLNARPSQLIGINQNSKNIEEAAKFLDWFFTNEQATLTLGVERSIPVRPTAKKLLLDHNGLDQVVAGALDTALAHQDAAPSYINNNQELLKISNEVVEKVAFGKVSPEAGAKEMVERYESKLKEIEAATKK